MNYIYDIYLNFNKIPYDFFEWNKNDSIIHIKKIPIIKVNEDTLIELINYNVKIDDDILDMLYKRTETLNNKNILYCSLFCDNNYIIAIEFNKDGISINKSFLCVEEELDVLENTFKYKEKEINYKLLNKQNTIFKTRNELNKENFIDKELKYIDNDKLYYIYFECFNKHEKDKKEIIKNIKNISKNSKTYKNLYDILKLTSTTKNKML